MTEHQTDHAVMGDSLEALGDHYDGMAAELFDRFIADHPQYAPVFLNPEAAQERMTRETLEAMLGLAAGEWWVDHAVTEFIDLHHNYADFTPQDYAAWFALVIETMANRAGPDWPTSANAAWQRQADGLVAKVATVARNQEVPVRI
tara:strand:+ start:2391 stop:2828 length:438 start_codon:yes stop_codon:yes gene_type:complete